MPFLDVNVRFFLINSKFAQPNPWILIKMSILHCCLSWAVFYISSPGNTSVSCTI